MHRRTLFVALATILHIGLTACCVIAADRCSVALTTVTMLACAMGSMVTGNALGRLREHRPDRGKVVAFRCVQLRRAG